MFYSDNIYMLACIGQTKHPIPLKINNANGLYFHAFFRNDELQEGKLIFCREKFSSENELV